MVIPSLVVDALAGYRLTKIVTDDVITRPIRKWVVDLAYSEVRSFPSDRIRDDLREDMTFEEVVDYDGTDAPRLAYLVTCRWCAGIYVAVVVVASRRLAPRVWAPLADALAVSAAAALLARLED